MGCAFCGEGDRWIKTCRTKDVFIRVCDPCWEVLVTCWEVLVTWLVVIPGDGVVTARCEGCGSYQNPQYCAKVSPGGRYDTYSGMCGACADKELRGLL
jgi:hypothetical protein